MHEILISSTNMSVFSQEYSEIRLKFINFANWYLARIVDTGLKNFKDT